jgi:hypothetical protein
MIDNNYQRSMARLINAFNIGDIDAFLRELAVDVKFRSPLAGESSGGHPSVRHLLVTARDRLRLRRLEGGPAFQNQTQIAMDLVGTAEAPGGGSLTMNIILVVEFAGSGLIQEVRFFWDPKPLLPHLGA